MFKSTTLNLAQYTPVGDITVMALCIIMSILVRNSFISGNKQRFRILIVNLLFIFISSASNILFEIMLNSTVLRPAPIFIFRFVYCILLSLVMYLYMQYISEPLWVPMKTAKMLSVIACSFIILAGIADIAGTFLGFGFYVTQNGDYHPGINFYIVLYALFMTTIIYQLVKYRSRLLKQVFFGLLSVNALSVLLLIVQEKHNQLSYTTLCYFLPIICIIFLFHSNPFDIDTGAVSSTFFFDELNDNLSDGKEMLIMCCTMPNFTKSITKSPELKTEFYNFFRQNVKKGILYHFPNERLVLTMVKQKKVDYNKSINKMLEYFYNSYDIFSIDYKITIIETSKSITNANDYYQLIEHAESKMPMNFVHRITSDDIESYYNSSYILSELRDIAEKKDPSDPRVLVYCQPVFNIRTGHYDTAEALMRLKLDKTGLVFPDKFIPIAEQHNLIHPLSMIILNKTCFAIRGFVEEDYDIKRISVNFSAIDIRYDNFCDEVKATIERNGIDYRKIAVEITESRSEADFNLMKQRVMQLQELGIKFYLDDFGTGYSNFERIMEIPFDIIKFDRSLLVESVKNDSSKYMVKTFANMFHNLKYSILFEGVENESDENRCILMKAQYLQGYKYSKPIPIDELRHFLSKKEEPPELKKIDMIRSRVEDIMKNV